MRSRSAVYLKGLAEARELARPRLTPEEVGERLGVDARTVRRWEEKGWVKLRYVPELETLYGVTFPEAHDGDGEGHEPAASGRATRPRIVGKIAMASGASDEDFNAAMQEVKDVFAATPGDTEAGQRVREKALDRFLELHVPDPVRRALYRETILQLNEPHPTNGTNGSNGSGRKSSNGDGEAH